MSTNPTYTEEQKTAFVEMAAEHGITFAMGELQYPASARAAYGWCVARDVRPASSSLMVAANMVRDWYGDVERRLAAQKILDASFDLLDAGKRYVRIDDETGETTTVFYPLKPRDLFDISMAVKNAIASLQLLDGAATEIISHEVAQPELLALVEEYRDRNAETIRVLKAAS